MSGAVRWVLFAVAGLLLSAIAVFLGASVANADAAASLDYASVSRDSSNGHLVFSAEVTASGYWTSDGLGVCSSRCTFTLQARPVNGSNVVSLGYAGISLPSSSASHYFSDEVSSLQIDAVRVVVSGDRGETDGAWISISDPYMAQSLSIDATTVSRDPTTGHFVFDVTAGASGFELPDSVCSDQWTSDCNLQFYAEDYNGRQAFLGAHVIPAGTTYPFSFELPGNIDSVKIAKIYATLSQRQGWGSSSLTSAAVSISDQYPTESLSIDTASVSREAATGLLDFNVAVSASEFELPDSVCSDQWTSDCNLQLFAEDDNNNHVTFLGARVIPPGTAYPFSVNVTGTGIDTTKMTKVYATLTQRQGYGVSSISSATFNVSDQYPSLSLSIDAATLSRDPSTGLLGFSVNASASGFELPDSVCSDLWNSDCNLQVFAEDDTGHAAFLGSHIIPSGTPYPFAINLPGSGVDATKMTKVYATLTQRQGYAYSSFSSATFPIFDPYPKETVTVSSAALIGGSGGPSSYKFVASATGFELPDTTCSSLWNAECDLLLYGETTDGAVTVLGSKTLPAGTTYPATLSATGPVTAPLTKVWSAIVSHRGYGPPPEHDSKKLKLRNLTTDQSRGGGNKSQRGCQCAGADPVNTLTGEFYEPATDVALVGVGPTLSVTRTYSALAASQDGPFGFGWASNFGTHLDFSSADADHDGLPDTVNVVQDNGSTTPFPEASDGTYPALPWVAATLTHSASTGQWTFVLKHAETFVFSSDGDLHTESDLRGNTVSYQHADGRVSSVTGSGARELDLTWNSGTGHVTSVSDGAGRTVHYYYNPSGNLTSVTGVDGSSFAYGYDSKHLMTTVTKPAGGVLTNVYDTQSRVASQTDEVGRTTTFSYGPDGTTQTNPDGTETVTTYNQGAISSITTDAGTADAATTSYGYDQNLDRISTTDPLGHTTTSTFDDNGDALTVTDPLGNVTTSTYNDLGEILTSTDPLGRKTTNTYDSDGGLLTTSTPEEHTTTLTYNSDGTLATSTDPRGKTTTYTYDSAGRPLCVTDPDTRETCQAYDDRGVVTSKTDAAGKVTHLTYDDAGRMLTQEDPNSHTTTYVYDSDGDLTSTQDASGNTVTATYDAANQRTTSTDGRGKTTTYTYTARGSVATVTDPNAHVTTNAYDGQNRLISVTDPDGHVTSYTYDLAGHKVSTTTPSGAVASSTYDDDGRVATTTDALGKVTTYAYDDAGQLHSVTDPLSRVTSYSYTDDGKLHVITLPDSSTETYAYNADDVQTQFENADGQTTSYAYDDAGLLTSETQPGSMTTSYTYDSAGRIHTVTTPDGVVGTRSYDDAGRPTGVNYPGTADDVSYTYFADGTRHTMTDGTGTTTYAYNANASLTSVQNGDGQTIGYGYDNASRLTSVTYPGSKTVTYGYDNAGNMTSVTDWASRTTTLTVTADGLQNTRTDPSGVTETRSYNANDQLTDINTATSSATLSDYGYGYDNAGQLTSSTVTDAIHLTTATNAWGYTNLGQLSSTGPSTGYTTSPAGELTATPAGDAFTYNTKQELASATNASAGTSTAYNYDDNGSRTATATTVSGTTTTVSYGYDSRGNLATVTTGGATVTYQSDGNGLRQSRTASGSTSQLLWDPNHAIPVLLDDGTNSYIYATGTTPIAQINDATSTIEYLHTDNVGSVRTITSAIGTVAGTTDYNPYGQVTSHTGSSNSAFGYASAWTDPTTSLDYLRAREYDSATGQFLQVDPALDRTRQPYEYVAGEPNNANDPTGLIPGGCGPNVTCPTAGEYNDLWASISKELNIAQAGFDNGATGGIPDSLGWTCSSYKSDNLYWTEYAIGGVVMTAATWGTGEEIVMAVKGALSAGRDVPGIIDDLIHSERGSIGGSDPENLSNAAKRVLGNLRDDSGQTAAEAIKSRGGGASQVNQLQTGYGQRTLGELAQEAAEGDPEAIKAIKMVKQAGTQGKGGK